MDKTNIDKITPGDRLSSLENLPSSEAGLTDSGEGQLLFDKDSPRGNAMRSITSLNKKDSAKVANLNNQQKSKTTTSFYSSKLYQTTFFKVESD